MPPCCCTNLCRLALTVRQLAGTVFQAFTQARPLSPPLQLAVLGGTVAIGYREAGQGQGLGAIGSGPAVMTCASKRRRQACGQCQLPACLFLIKAAGRVGRLPTLTP